MNAGANEPSHPGMLTDLTDLERRLIDAARRGDWLLCSDLNHDELRATGPDLWLRGQVIRELLLGWHGDVDPRGVRVQGARITGALDLEHVQAARGLSLDRCVLDQAAVLRFAHLPWLSLSDIRLPALDAEGLRIDGNMFLRQAVISNSDELTPVTLMDTHIGGMLEIPDARLTSTTGPALDAGRIRVDGSMFLKDSIASGTGRLGAICLLDAHVGGELDLKRTHLTNTAGPALNAGGMHVDGRIFLNDKFTATANSTIGAVSLVDAHIGGELTMHGARLTNTAGPALNAGGMHVDDRIFLNDKFTATANSTQGAVSLLGAQISGQVHLQDANLVNPLGPLIDLQDARCGLLFLPPGLICPQSRVTSRSCPDADLQVYADGFVYTDIAYINSQWQQWLHLLRCHTGDYRPMPYQQLAAIRTAAGHDRDARRILIVQQQDHRARGDIGGLLRRTTHRLWGALAGYGYRTGRTALALLIVLLLAGGMGWWAGHTTTGPGRHAAERPTTQAACSTVELIGLGIDRGLPLASTGIRARCDLDTASEAGQRFTVAIWLLQAVVWALATLALAGYTGLVRKIR